MHVSKGFFKGILRLCIVVNDIIIAVAVIVYYMVNYIV